MLLMLLLSGKRKGKAWEAWDISCIAFSEHGKARRAWEQFVVIIEKHGKAGEAWGNCFGRELKAWGMYVKHGDSLSLIWKSMEKPGKHGETLLG